VAKRNRSFLTAKFYRLIVRPRCNKCESTVHDSMPGWRSLYLYNSTGNSIMAAEEEERVKMAYDMAEMERIFRISPFPPTGDLNSK
jgi:hypothetical protein